MTTVDATGKEASFDPALGFTVTNNTGQNVYLQTNDTKFEKILPGDASTSQTAARDYPVRSNDTTDAPVFLTVQVATNGAVTLDPGTLRGELSVFVNFK